MARIRSIKPDTFVSYALHKVCIEARYLFIGMWTEADDSGRLMDAPKRLAGAIFPHDDHINADTVVEWITDLEDIGVVHRYTVNAGQYLEIPGWFEHQRISHPSPSKFPDPPVKRRRNSGKIPNDSGKIPEDHGKIPETLRRNSGLIKEQGVRNKEQGVRSGKKTLAPESFEITPALKEWATKDHYDQTVDLERETQNFLDHHASKGSEMVSWDRAWQKWIRTADGYAQRRKPKSSSTDSGYVPANQMTPEQVKATYAGMSTAEWPSE